VELDLNPGEIYIIKNSGLAYIGEASNIMDECVFPQKISQNHGFSPDATVTYKGNIVGKIVTSKIKKGKLYYSVKLNMLLNDEGIYNCGFEINKMFSNFSGSKYFLDQIIVDNINIETKTI